MLTLTEVDVFWQVFGRFHPLLVHFPIALILLAALLETFWYVLGRRADAAPAAGVCLWSGLIGGGLSLWAGWMLAAYDGEVGPLVTLHRWTAVAAMAVLALAGVAWLLRRWKGRDWAAPHLALTLIGAVLIVVCSHFGGEMAWGEGWVFGPLRDTGPGWASAEPILVSHCQKCHGPKKQKGDLQLIPWSKMFDGDPADWVVRPGDAAGSTLHTLITKPVGDEDIMPPADKAEPLSDEQVQVLTDWIDAGCPGPDGQAPPAVVASPESPAT